MFAEIPKPCVAGSNPAGGAAEAQVRLDPPAGEAVVGDPTFAGKDAEAGKKRYVTRTVRGERRDAEVASAGCSAR